MAEVIFPGAAGWVEGRYNEPKREGAPIALVLHGHPRAGGSMQDRVTVQLYKLFTDFGFATLRASDFVAVLLGLAAFAATRLTGDFFATFADFLDVLPAIVFTPSLLVRGSRRSFRNEAYNDMSNIRGVVWYLAVAPTVDSRLLCCVRASCLL